MNKTANYSVEIIRYVVEPEQYEQFESAYTNGGKFLQKSPFCLGYNIIHGEDEPNNYLVTIYWTSKEEHLNGFRNSKEFKVFFY